MPLVRTQFEGVYLRLDTAHADYASAISDLNRYMNSLPGTRKLSVRLNGRSTEAIVKVPMSLRLVRTLPWFDTVVIEAYTSDRNRILKNDVLETEWTRQV